MIVKFFLDLLKIEEDLQQQPFPRANELCPPQWSANQATGEVGEILK